MEAQTKSRIMGVLVWDGDGGCHWITEKPDGTVGGRFLKESADNEIYMETILPNEIDIAVSIPNDALDELWATDKTEGIIMAVIPIGVSLFRGTWNEAIDLLRGKEEKIQAEERRLEEELGEKLYGRTDNPAR